MRVLVIEDHAEMAEAVATGLRRAQMAVDVAVDGPSGLERALTADFSVILLDRDLPGIHGDEICSRLITAGCRSRVLMLTAAAASEDLVDGLGLGADDYLAKPFDFPVLVARIGALARRAHPAVPPVLRLGDLVVDMARRCAAGRAGRWICRPRSSASSSCWPRPGAGPSRPKSCWSGCGTSSPTRSPPR